MGYNCCYDVEWISLPTNGFIKSDDDYILAHVIILFFIWMQMRGNFIQKYMASSYLLQSKRKLRTDYLIFNFMSPYISVYEYCLFFLEIYRCYLCLLFCFPSDSPDICKSNAT